MSFGVAPAVLGYTLGLRGFWDVVCLTWFVCCGISRLARFNVTSAALTNAATGKVRYFEGTPIPTSVILVFLLAVSTGWTWSVKASGGGGGSSRAGFFTPSPRYSSPAGAS